MIYISLEAERHVRGVACVSRVATEYCCSDAKRNERPARVWGLFGEVRVTSAGRIGWGGAALLWAGLVAYGFGLWNAYELRPGEIPDPTAASVSSRSPTGCWRVMTFVHPHCPCSQASVLELRRVLQELARVAPKESVQASILIVRPPEAPAGWEHGEILREVQRWNEVSVTVDQGGETARQWAVATSGHVIVLDPQGRVRFRGGITSGR